MTYYLDKENNILFIKPNAKVELKTIQDISKLFEELRIPYKVIILDHDDELVII
ncbi:hypothetical protein [Mammaliicoccus sciuri]|uniref:hypothetical protein n=1 Tax=Mammaliicoccus sciuri TaxID=1296 RepID=UPI00288705AB|nr:hypothetical protein [Mammaliicoccus sciuri]MDT0754002.1 hypothetical protein [Mammaliicoccus sciuri]